jgi:predicted enzyme related to lactoylglutathione lyase
MPVRLHHIVLDAHDLPRLARFWTQALGWADPEGNEFCVIRPKETLIR